MIYLSIKHTIQLNMTGTEWQRSPETQNNEKCGYCTINVEHSKTLKHVRKTCSRSSTTGVLLRDLLDEGKLLRSTRGTVSLLQMLMTLSVKKKGLTQSIFYCELRVLCS